MANPEWTDPSDWQTLRDEIWSILMTRDDETVDETVRKIMEAIDER